ncbi:hypothetical protein Hanom_Chr05g00428321 [Helianthus anomalus]
MFFNPTYFSSLIIALQYKTPHNYLLNFEKTNKNTPFHSITDVLTSSKYNTILIADAPIHVDTLWQFWANVEVQSQNKKPFGIMSKAGKTSFEKQEIHIEFIERGYEGKLTGVTIFKPKIHVEIKLFFHTLLISVSAKTTSFNEIPQKVQYLGYVVLTKTYYNLSQALFSELVANVNNVKKGSNNAFLMYPRLLSYYLKK